MGDYDDDDDEGRAFLEGFHLITKKVSHSMQVTQQEDIIVLLRFIQKLYQQGFGVLVPWLFRASRPLPGSRNFSE